MEKGEVEILERILEAAREAKTMRTLMRARLSEIEYLALRALGRKS